MAELAWLPAYTGQTLDELLSLAQTYRIDSLMVALEQAIGQKSDTKGAKSLSPEERVVLAVEALEREVNNGGYSQFFINTSGEFAPIIVEALQRIGCPKTAAATKAAIAALHVKDFRPANLEKVFAEDNEERDEDLARCDEQFYKSGEDIAGKLFAFVKANQASFSF